jgi:hypothetical protein
MQASGLRIFRFDRQDACLPRQAGSLSSEQSQRRLAHKRFPMFDAAPCLLLEAFQAAR